jgi:Ca2+/Na+ antiporter
MLINDKYDTKLNEVKNKEVSSCWIAVLFGSYCLWILLIYFLTGLRKNEEYLRKVEKWDSPKRLVLMLIPLWIVCAVLYYMNPYRWIFYYGIAFSLVYLHGAYLRNIYRRELKT